MKMVGKVENGGKKWRKVGKGGKRWEKVDDTFRSNKITMCLEVRSASRGEFRFQFVKISVSPFLIVDTNLPKSISQICLKSETTD